MDRTTSREVPELQNVVDQKTIVDMKAFARDVPVARHVQDYALRILKATHPEYEDAPDITTRYVRFGSSPRGAQAIILSAKVRALLDGRFNVSSDDIRASTFPALRHRIILNFEGEAEGVSTDDILETIIDNTAENAKD